MENPSRLQVGSQDSQPKPIGYDNKGLASQSPVSNGIEPGEWTIPVDLGQHHSPSNFTERKSLSSGGVRLVGVAREGVSTTSIDIQVSAISRHQPTARQQKFKFC